MKIASGPRALVLLVLVALAALLGHGRLAWAEAELPAPGDYVVDSEGSNIGFNVTNFLVTNVDGKFTRSRGHVVVGDSLATTRIEAVVDVASLDTENTNRDEHLRSADFFDAQKYPTMSFNSTQIWGTPGNFGIKGNLTIKGVTKEVTFSAKVLDAGVIRAETKIDRTDFGITSGTTVKNEVRLRLDVHITKPGVAAPAPH